eukprot:GFUD01062867.1.p1 GENE.GFUD01062867.1~~GFUD01062867.1.p1  ORF type:complete len:247 (-),score=88.23 GFUD01062867.1:113-766(-)
MENNHYVVQDLQNTNESQEVFAKTYNDSRKKLIKEGSSLTLSPPFYSQTMNQEEMTDIFLLLSHPDCQVKNLSTNKQDMSTLEPSFLASRLEVVTISCSGVTQEQLLVLFSVMEEVEWNTKALHISGTDLSFISPSSLASVLNRMEEVTAWDCSLTNLQVTRILSHCLEIGTRLVWLSLGTAGEERVDWEMVQMVEAMGEIPLCQKTKDRTIISANG